MSLYIRYPAQSGGSGGVSSINSITGAANIVAGSGVTVTPSGQNISIAAVPSSASLVWTKYTVTAAQLSAAGTSNDIHLFTLGANEVISGYNIKTSIAFSGGGVSTYAINLGDAVGGPNFIINAWEGTTAPSDINFLYTISGYKSTFASSDIRVQGVADVNLNTVTSGSVDIWILKSTLP